MSGHEAEVNLDVLGPPSNRTTHDIFCDHIINASYIFDEGRSEDAYDYLVRAGNRHEGEIQINLLIYREHLQKLQASFDNGEIKDHRDSSRRLSAETRKFMDSFIDSVESLTDTMNPPEMRTFVWRTENGYSIRCRGRVSPLFSDYTDNFVNAFCQIRASESPKGALSAARKAMKPAGILVNYSVIGAETKPASWSFKHHSTNEQISIPDMDLDYIISRLPTPKADNSAFTSALWDYTDFEAAKKEIETAHPHITLYYDQDDGFDVVSFNVALPSRSCPDAEIDEEHDHFSDRDEAVDEIGDHAAHTLSAHGVYLTTPIYTEGFGDEHWVSYHVNDGPTSTKRGPAFQGPPPRGGGSKLA